MEKLMLNYEDNYFSDTFTYQYFKKEFLDKIDDLRKEAERLDNIYTVFLNELQKRKYIPFEDFECFLAWCNHSDKTPTQIIYDMYYRNKKEKE